MCIDFLLQVATLLLALKEPQQGLRLRENILLIIAVV
jgi:hypothetical protein